MFDAAGWRGGPGRSWSRGALPVTVISLLTAVAGCAGSTPPPTPKSASCAATAVHYAPYPGGEPGLAQLPWVAASPRSSGIVGHLFYYDDQNIWKQRHLPRVRIYSKGQSPDGRLSMKILWQTPHPGVSPRLRGDRLDGAGSFSEQLSPTASNPRQLPSIVAVPAAGCWRLTLTAGTATGDVTALAVPGRAS